MFLVDQKVLDFLNSQRVCSLAVVMPDGGSHSAAMHYSHQVNPLVIYVQTENTSKKCQGLLSGQSISASVAVGFDEQKMVTLQMDGHVQLVTDLSTLPKIHELHYAKHPHAAEYKSDPATVFLAFTPIWWRYTDFKQQLTQIISSDSA